MLVDVEIRGRLSHFLPGERADARRPQTKHCVRLLDRCEQDPVLKAKMDRVQALKDELASL